MKNDERGRETNNKHGCDKQIRKKTSDFLKRDFATQISKYPLMSSPMSILFNVACDFQTNPNVQDISTRIYIFI